METQAVFQTILCNIAHFNNYVNIKEVYSDCTYNNETLLNQFFPLTSTSQGSIVWESSMEHYIYIYIYI